MGYRTSPLKAIASGVLGCWLHVALDALIYHDIRPLHPFILNPLLGWIDQQSLYLLCLLLFIPAGVLYWWKRGTRPSAR